jgi:hypothetical protein
MDSSSFNQGIRGYIKEQKKAARHEAAHFIVMVNLFADNLPLITKVELLDDKIGGKVSYSYPNKEQLKKLPYVFLAGEAMDSKIQNGDYESLLTIELPNKDSDLDQYLYLYFNIYGVNLHCSWNHDETREIIIKDLQYSVELCKKLERHIKNFADILLRDRIIEGDPLAKQIKLYSEKYLSEDFS